MSLTSLRAILNMGWVSVLLILSPAFLVAQPSQVCIEAFKQDPNFQAVEIRYVAKEYPLEVLQTLNRDGLAALAKGDVHMDHSTHINGLTVSHLSSSVNGSFRTIGLEDGSKCVWPAKVDMTLGYDDMKVYVARDFPLGSCQYKVTLDHEMHHVRINEDIIRSSIPWIVEDTREMIARAFPIRIVPGRHDPQAPVNEISAYLALGVNRMLRERDMHHAQLDSPSSYRYWQSLCSEW